MKSAVLLLERVFGIVLAIGLEWSPSGDGDLGVRRVVDALRGAFGFVRHRHLGLDHDNIDYKRVTYTVDFQ